MIMEFLNALPVDPAVLAAFVVAGGAVVLSPGPDTILIIRYTMSSGTGVGMTTMAGVQAGLLTHTVLAILGISVVIASSAILFNGIAIAGALYLAWLGVQGFRDGGLDFDSRGGVATVSHGKAARDALLSNVLNPKVILLYLALMPNFLDLGKDNTAAQLAELGIVLILINIVWQVGLVLMADRARAWLGTPKVQVWVSRITGGVLIFFAVAMIWTNVV